MEYLSLIKTNEGFHIEGFPDAVKVIKLECPKARRLASMVLHMHDLEFALRALESINGIPADDLLTRQALLCAAITNYFKCFGPNKARLNNLVAKTIHRGDPEGLAIHVYFDHLRNKHFVHDENSLLQCLPGAILNREGTDAKIAKIVSFCARGYTLSQPDYSNLHLLITKSLDWARKDVDRLCKLLSDELETRDYDELFRMKTMAYSKPVLEDIGKMRMAT